MKNGLTPIIQSEMSTWDKILASIPTVLNGVEMIGGVISALFFQGSQDLGSAADQVNIPAGSTATNDGNGGLKMTADMGDVTVYHHCAVTDPGRVMLNGKMLPVFPYQHVHSDGQFQSIHHISLKKDDVLTVERGYLLCVKHIQKKDILYGLRRIFKKVKTPFALPSVSLNPFYLAAVKGLCEQFSIELDMGNPLGPVIRNGDDEVVVQAEVATVQDLVDLFQPVYPGAAVPAFLGTADHLGKTFRVNALGTTSISANSLATFGMFTIIY